MKSPKTKYQIIIASLIITRLIFAQTSERPGFFDENHDGINDSFCDKNGDGINDVTHQHYQHNFIFEDRNGDGINDFFVDEDGDGVNDLAKSFTDHDGDGWNDNVIDNNHDWINDITGLVYDLRHFHGGRYGMVLEEIGFRVENYNDINNDGRYDDFGLFRRRMGSDQFIDNDGDGMFDGRGFNKHRKNSNRSKGRK
ncbi:MAG: hypothetical protein JXQ65_15615 [Candidatus Marinimicrobia bacterium]|nr:hypothetical protein [Candidatus Neomarinimicrobiota bacterium]